MVPSLTSLCSTPVVQETVRTDRVVEVQPVVHREIEQPIVHHVEEHIVERAPPSMAGVVQRPPIVEEHTHTRVVNGMAYNNLLLFMRTNLICAYRGTASYPQRSGSATGRESRRTRYTA